VEIRPVWTPEDFGADAAAIEHAQMEQMAAQAAEKAAKG